MNSLWTIAAILLAISLGMQIRGLIEDSKKVEKYNHPLMHYEKIDGKIINVTVDSLECVLLQMEIEQRLHNEIFQYSIPKKQK